MAVNWNPAYETGIAEVDNAHKNLFEVIDKLTNAMKSGNGKQEVLQTVNFLEKYAVKHFSHEEECMRKYQCPAAQANIKAHGEFKKYVSDLKQKLEQSEVGSVMVLEIHGELASWLRNHITKIDIHLKACSKEAV